VAPPGEDDRRSEARLSPGDLECDIEGTRFAHILGVTIGGHGMRVMTDKALPSDRAVGVEVHLTDTESLNFNGLRVWSESKNFEFTQRFISGVRFVDPDPAACERLHAFIEDFLAREHPEKNPAGGGANEPS